MLGDFYKKDVKKAARDEKKDPAVDYRKMNEDKARKEGYEHRQEEAKEKWEAAADAKKFDLKKKEDERKRRELSTKRIMLESADHHLKSKKEAKQGLLDEAGAIEAAGGDAAEKKAAAAALDHEIASAKSESERLHAVVKRLEGELGAHGFSEDV